MTNESIRSAFERFWSHVVTALGNKADVNDLVEVEDSINELLTNKADKNHDHNDKYYTETEIDTKLNGKSDSNHNHDSKYDAKGSANTAIDTAKAYTDKGISGVEGVLNAHTSNSTVHVTSENKTNWSQAYTHSTSAHAPSNAEKNKIVGVQVNGSDLTINSSTRKVNVTVPTKASDVGADPAGSASSALENAKTYTDSAVSNKANVSHKHVVTDITGLTASVDELNYMDGVTSNVQTQLDTKADKSDIATTVFQGTATENNTYWKISDFGNWGTGAWYQKGFSMLISSRAGELIWVSIAANDSNTSAEAIRLMNRYSKIGALYYSASESAIYVLAAGWANNICAHILTNVNGDYVPTITNASGLPSDAAAIGITEFGASASETNVGSSQKTLELRGSEDRPSYNFTDLALFSDIPTDYAKAEDVNNSISGLQESISGLQGSLDKHSTNEENARSTAIATAKQEAIDIAAADATTKANKALKDANTYTDDKVALLMNNSSDAIDSIMELADAMKTNEDVVDALEDAVGTKASKSDLNSHTNNKSNPHGVTAEQTGALPITGGTLTGSLVAPIYKTDTTDAAIKPSDSNEVNFGSNTHYVYFGYENRIGSPGAVNTYYFGTHSGADGSKKGTIECGKVVEDGTELSSKYALKAEIPTDYAKKGHGHVISDVSGLQEELDKKAPSAHLHVVSDITDLTATATELNYMDGVTSNVQTQLDGKATSGHTHNYAGSDSVGGAATSANKVNKTLTVKLNSGTTENTNLFTFNGSADKIVNITPSSIGASASGHNHDDRYYTETEIDTKLNGKSNIDHTHSYAGSNTIGGSANSAVKLDSSAGSVNQPVYFEDGKPKAINYTIDKSVPADAQFTDTIYTLPAAGGALGGVCTGGDVTISDGIISVNDDSHNHIISNVDGLQTALDAKQTAIDSHVGNKSNPHGVTCSQVGALPLDKVSGNSNKVAKFTGSNQINDSNITDDGATVTIGSKMVVQGNGSSYNEGIRVLPATNGWSNMFFSGDSTVSGCHDGGWLIGRRGAVGGMCGDIGDFTIENNDSSGKGLTLHKNGNATIYGSTLSIANKKASVVYDASNECMNFVFN